MISGQPDSRTKERLWKRNGVTTPRLGRRSQGVHPVNNRGPVYVAFAVCPSNGHGGDDVTLQEWPGPPRCFRRSPLRPPGKQACREAGGTLGEARRRNTYCAGLAQGDRNSYVPNYKGFRSGRPRKR